MANNLTLTNATFDTTGEKFGTAALSGGYGVAPGGLITGFPFTIETWFKRGSNPPSLEVIMGQSGTGFMGMTASGAIEMELGNGSGATPAVTSPGTFADGNWHHAALTVTASTFTAFVDGAVIGTGTTPPMASFTPSGAPPNGIGMLAIGNHGGSLQFQFGGETDEAAVWNTARYTAAFTPPTTAYAGTETGLLALYHLDSNGTDSAGVAWTPIINYRQTAAAAVGAVGNGWTDVGPSWNGYEDSSSNYYLGNEYIAGSPWNTGQLVRKAVSEAAVNARVQVRFAIFEACDLWVMMRYVAQNGDGNATALMVKPDQYFVLNNGQLTSTGGTGQTMAAGSYYDMDASVVQQGQDTLVTVATYSVGDPINSAFGSGSVITNNTFTVTDPAVQNLSGGQGMFFYDSTQSAGGKIVYEFASFTGDGVAVATTYTLTGPANGQASQASGAFTVQCAGSTSSAVTVTPSDNGAGGAFNPTAVVFAAGSSDASATFTYTPSGAGTKNISTTNSGSLTNPAALTYAATSLITLGVASPALQFSPGNWRGDTGRGGVLWRQSWNNGAWLTAIWLASASPTATLVLNSPNSANRVSYFLNGVLNDNIGVTGNLVLSNIVPSAINVLRIYLRSSPQSSRWANGSNTVQVRGLQVDSGSAAGVAPSNRPWGLLGGDSITEGIAANGGSDDTLMDYSFLLGRALDQLGYDTCVSACGYSGWIHTGDGNPGDVPAYYSVSGSTNGAGGTYSDSASRWNKVDSGVSLLDSNGLLSAYGAINTPPAFVYINYMTNEALSGLNASDAQASVAQCLAALRAAAPNAWLFIQVPFGMYSPTVFPNTAYMAALKNGVAAYRNARPTDSKVKLIDFGAALSQTINSAPYINTDNVHPIAAGHALVAPMVAQAIVSSLLGQARSPNYR